MLRPSLSLTSGEKVDDIREVISWWGIRRRSLLISKKCYNAVALCDHFPPRKSTWKSQIARLLGQLPAQYLAWMCLPQGMCSSLSVESHLKVLPAHIAPACAFVTNCTFLTNCSVWSPQVDAFGVLSPRGMHNPESIYFTENKEEDRFSIS